MLHHRRTAEAGTDNSVIATAFEKNLRAVNAWLDSEAFVKRSVFRITKYCAMREHRAEAYAVFGNPLGQSDDRSGRREPLLEPLGVVHGRCAFRTPA